MVITTIEMSWIQDTLESRGFDGISVEKGCIGLWEDNAAAIGQIGATWRWTPKHSARIFVRGADGEPSEAQLTEAVRTALGDACQDVYRIAPDGSLLSECFA